VSTHKVQTNYQYSNSIHAVANHDKTLIDSEPLSEPAELKGYLTKFTNVARGYHARWFVLRDGVLSCESNRDLPHPPSESLSPDFRHQEDETIASRGSISMKTAILKVAPSGDKLRFEVHSTPSRGHNSGVQRWYMKANHPVEAHRWTQAIGKSIAWHKREVDGRKSPESDASGFKNHPDGRSVLAPSLRKQARLSQGDSASSFAEIAGTGEDEEYGPAGASPGRRDDADSVKNDDSSAVDSLRRLVPHKANFELHSNSTSAQLELTSQLLSSLSLPPGGPTGAQELRSALRDSLEAAESMFHEYVQMVKDREEWWKHKLDRESQRQKVWEESLQLVVREGEALEQELRQRSRRRGSRLFDSSVSESMGTLRAKSVPMSLSSSLIVEGRELVHPVPSPLTAAVSPSVSSPFASLSLVEGVSTPTAQAISSPSTVLDVDTDDEDEFFDAIEFNQLPNLVVPEPLDPTTHQEPTTLTLFDAEPFTGYKHFRLHLSIDSDNRPSTSLWSVLKHSIGKDLTRISFPVFFNEPTSMLQRMVSSS
jgi:hypothetical protein